MRHIIIFITTVFISTFASKSLLAQVDTNAISRIKAFTKYIDSLSDNDEGQKLVIKSIEEGRITEEVFTTTDVENHTRIDSTRKIRNGGFGKCTIQNIKGDTVYKIAYHDNINKNYYEIFFYRNNKLVYSKIDYQKDGIGQTFYYKEEYYDDNEILFVNESTESIEAEFRERVTFNLRKKGDAYFEKFKIDRK